MNPKTNVTRGGGLLETFLAKKRVAQADRLIPASYRTGRIVDIGCGSYPLFLLHTDFKEKYGVDKVVDADYRHRFSKDKIHFKYFDMEQKESVPFENCHFDVVTLLAVFEHLEPDVLTRLVAEIYRILKPEGLFVITTPAFWTKGLLTGMSKLKLVSPVEIEEHKAHYAPSQIISFLENGSFVKEKMNWGWFELFMNTWVAARK